MSAVKFLLDEHVTKRLGQGLERVDATIPLLRIGEPAGPAFRTLDPELLKWAEANGYSIITLDESTMISHANDHLRSGGHTWGIFILRSGFSLGKIIDTLAVIGLASQVEEWRDQIVFVPFS